MSKRTLGGTKRKAIKISGFRARMKNPTGKNIIKSRRKAGRKKLSL